MVNQISDEESVLRSMATKDLSSNPIRIPGSNDERCLRVPGRFGTVNLLRAAPLNWWLLPLIGRSLRIGPGRLSKASFQLSTVNLFRGVPLNTATSAILEDQQ